MKIARAYRRTPDLMRLQEICLPDDRALHPNDGMWWIAEEGGLAGFASLHQSEPEPTTFYLSRCGVVPEYRGRGLQLALIRRRLQHARQIGGKWAISDTTENEPSANNLIRAGFLLYTPAAPWAGPTTLYWRRPL